MLGLDLYYKINTMLYFSPFSYVVMDVTSFSFIHTTRTLAELLKISIKYWLYASSCEFCTLYGSVY